MTTVLDLGGQVAEALRHYVERNPESHRLHEERAQFMPGGNTRTVIHVDPFPLTVVRGEGARIVDADGHEYLDFLGEYTAGLYGHSHPVVAQAIREALAGGVFLFKDGERRLNAPFPFVIGTYNDADEAVRLVAAHAHELAAVLVEPVQGSGGVI